MWDCYLADVMYLSTDLLSGKGVPVLVAAVTLPMDPNLLGTVVLLGAFLGSLWTVAQARRASPASTPVQWANRAAQLLFSCFLSLSLFFRVAPSPNLAVIPLFFTSVLYVPDRRVSQFVLFSLSFVAFFFGLIYEVEERPHRHHKHRPQPQRELMSFMGGDPQLMSSMEEDPQLMSLTGGARSLMALPPLEGRDYLMQYPEESPVADNLLYSATVLLLTVYATVQHGALEPRRNLSVEFIVNPVYALWPSASSALLRAYVVMRVAWVHTNLLHLIIEGKEPSSSGLFLALLGFSAAWNGTLLTEQTLTFWPGDRLDRRMRATAALLAVAHWFSWGDAWAGYGATLVFAAVSLGAGVI